MKRTHSLLSAAPFRCQESLSVIHHHENNGVAQQRLDKLLIGFIDPGISLSAFMEKAGSPVSVQSY